MLGFTIFRLIALAGFAQVCLPLPVGESSIEVREASPQWLPGAGETAEQADGTIREESHSSTAIPKDKRDPLPANFEKDFPLTHAVLKAIRDAIPEPDDGLHKRQNGSSGGSSSEGSGLPFLSDLSPQTQSTLKDTIRYGVALVMKTGSWALSP